MNFETWKEFYQWSWATKAQIAQAVVEGMITAEQYQEIVGEAYPSATPAPTPEVKPEVSTPTPTPEASTPAPASTTPSVA